MKRKIKRCRVPSLPKSVLFSVENIRVGGENKEEKNEIFLYEKEKERNFRK